MTKRVDIKVKVTKTVKDKGQKQITVIGLPEREDKKPLSFKKGVTCLIHFKYKKLEKVVNGELVVGDTHGIHRSHQSETQVGFFDDLFERLSEPQTITKENVSHVINPLDKEIPLTVEIFEAASAVADSADIGLILS